MKKVILLLVVSLPFILTSCNKDKLPKATEKGKNTFGCKIDGQIFLPSKEKSSWSGVDPILVINSSFDGFIVSARLFGTSSSTSKSVTIGLPYLTTTGTHSLKTYGYGEYKLEYSQGPKYRTNNTNTGTINITRCDTINRIYSGKFSFKAIDENTGKTVNVTDGRFDVQRKKKFKTQFFKPKTCL